MNGIEALKCQKCLKYRLKRNFFTYQQRRRLSICRNHNTAMIQCYIFSPRTEETLNSLNRVCNLNHNWQLNPTRIGSINSITKNLTRQELARSTHNGTSFTIILESSVLTNLLRNQRVPHLLYLCHRCAMFERTLNRLRKACRIFLPQITKRCAHNPFLAVAFK